MSKTPNYISINSNSIFKNLSGGIDNEMRLAPPIDIEKGRKIQKLNPELKGVLAVDEIAGLTTSMRRGSGPYAIFGQVRGNDFKTSVNSGSTAIPHRNIQKHTGKSIYNFRQIPKIVNFRGPGN